MADITPLTRDKVDAHAARVDKVRADRAANEAARAAVAALPSDNSHPSDFDVPHSIRAQVASIFDDLCDAADSCQDMLDGDDDGAYPGFRAVIHKLEEAAGPLLSALQAARQTELADPTRTASS